MPNKLFQIKDSSNLKLGGSLFLCPFRYPVLYTFLLSYPQFLLVYQVRDAGKLIGRLTKDPELRYTPNGVDDIPF